jgi:hypothetical protein
MAEERYDDAHPLRYASVMKQTGGRLCLVWLCATLGVELAALGIASVQLVGYYRTGTPPFDDGRCNLPLALLALQINAIVSVAVGVTSLRRKQNRWVLLLTIAHGLQIPVSFVAMVMLGEAYIRAY